MSLLFAATTTDRIDFGSPALLDNLHASTFSGWAWVYRTATGSNQYILSKDQSGPNGWGLLLVTAAGEGTVEFYAFRSTAFAARYSDASNLVPLNTWTLVGFTYDPAGSPQIKLYIGSLTATIAEVSGYSTTNVGSGSATADASANMYLGNLQRANTNSFRGRIARAGLATGVLTAADFARIQWESAPNNRPPGFIWGVDLYGTGTAVDLSGAGNNGTVTGTTAGDHVPLPAPYGPLDGNFAGGSAAADTTKPVYAGASVPSNGLTVSVSMTDAGSILPTTGVTGFTVTVAGAAATISSATASGTTITLNLSTAVYAGQTVTVAYTPGNVTDNALNVLDAFTAQSVTNNSTVVNSIAPNHANIVYPIPDVWGTMSSTHARCNKQGNSFVFAVNVTANEDVSISFDTSRFNGLTASTIPTIAVQMDGAFVDLNGDGKNYKQLTNAANAQTVTIATAPSNGRHVFRFWIRSFEAVSAQALGPWGTGGSIPPNAVDITSINLGPTSTMGTVTAGTDYFTDTALVFSHSRGCGVLANLEQGDSATTTNAANNNAIQSWPVLLRARLRCEIGFVAQGGVTLNAQSGTFQGGATANPPMYGASGAGVGEMFSTYNWNGNAITFSQTHKYLIIVQGVLGPETQAMMQGLMTALRSACGTTPTILWTADPTAGRTSTMAAAVAAQVGSDAKVKMIDPAVAIIDGSTPSTYASDGSHMNHQGQIQWANLVYTALVAAGVVTPSSGSRNRRGRGRSNFAALARVGV